MAFRYKVRIIDGLLFVKLKLPYRTTIVKSEVVYFSNKFVRGFLGMKQKNKRLLEYSGPAAITLQDRLKRPLTERDYFIIMEQIVDVTMTLSKEKLPWNKVNWDINAIFINETSMGIRVMYLPLEQINDNDSVVQLIDKLNDCAVIQSDKTENCVIRFRRFLNGIGVFDPSRIELFIAKEDPYAIIWAGKDVPHGVNDPSSNPPPNPPPAPEPPPTIPGNIPGIYHPPVNDDGPEEVDTGILGVDLACIAKDDDYIATGLLVDAAKENAANPGIVYPKLQRLSTGEVIPVNKPVFRIGKERSYVDYFVTNNNAVSRGHADIITRSNRYYVVDRNSKNKTFINDTEIPPECEVELFNGNLLTLGNENFIFIA